MEDLHGNHKQVPFGWVLWLQVATRRGGLSRRRAATKAVAFETHASGLNQPSAPH